jgi:hypothetical protein
MNTPVKFETAKLLKEKGFDLECEFFYSKYGSFNYLKPHREYEHLHSYSEQLISYFDGKYDWNSLDVDEGMIALKTAFSESDGYVNCECSAPTIAEVVIWLYEKHGIWTEVQSPDYPTDKWAYVIHKPFKYGTYGDGENFNSPIEAYEAAIDYTLKNLI